MKRKEKLFLISFPGEVDINSFMAALENFGKKQGLAGSIGFNSISIEELFPNIQKVNFNAAAYVDYLNSSSSEYVRCVIAVRKLLDSIPGHNLRSKFIAAYSEGGITVPLLKVLAEGPTNTEELHFANDFGGQELAELSKGIIALMKL